MNEPHNSETNPLISVVIPAYNAESFIEHTLTSVLQQTYQNIEVLVVDDGSQDSTADIVKSFAQSDSRVILLSQSNSGLSSARNQGIKHAKGEFIAFIDADDIYYPLCIEKLTHAMLKADESIGLAYAWSAHIDDTGGLIRGFNCSLLEGEVYNELLSRNFIGNGSAVMVRRCCIDQVGGYSCEMKSGCEDWDFYLRIAEHYQFKVVPEFLIAYRKLATSMSRSIVAMEKAYEQFLENAQKRNSEISTEFIHTSKSWYFLYLNSQSRSIRRYYESLKYLYKAFVMNPRFRFNLQFYKALVVTLSEIMTSPFTFLVWPDNITWTKFRQQLRRGYYKISNLSELYPLAEKSLPK
jgi:glycosyltransferase involved in cell wall biosynthesis